MSTAARLRWVAHLDSLRGVCAATDVGALTHALRGCHVRAEVSEGALEDVVAAVDRDDLAVLSDDAPDLSEDHALAGCGVNGEGPTTITSPVTRSVVMIWLPWSTSVFPVPVLVKVPSAWVWVTGLRPPRRGRWRRRPRQYHESNGSWVLLRSALSLANRLRRRFPCRVVARPGRTGGRVDGPRSGRFHRC